MDICGIFQISSGQSLISHYVNLDIVVPEATIQGSASGEHHVDVGSIIDLICIIDNSPTPPQYVFWYHNDKMINYDNARGGITVETALGPPRAHSRLTIQNTKQADSGNYTCSASNTEPASIHISSGQSLISHYVNLDIVVPEATIQGSASGEHHVDVGSIIDLICIIDNIADPLGHGSD
ncbi:hypothetical protein YQE_11782, partial [Dendroctonus ponderosae]